jgi:hypothetical protein
MDTAWSAYGLYGLELVVPFVLAYLVPRRARLIVIAVVGVAWYATISALAYRSSLAQNGGDSASGADTAGLVAVLNAIQFLPLWSFGALFGWKLRSRRDVLRIVGREPPHATPSPR